MSLAELIRDNNLKQAQILIEQGADVDECDEGGYTPLMYASRNGHLQLVQKLLEAGADVNAVRYEGPYLQFSVTDYDPDSEGEFALLLAALKEHREVFQYLAPKTALQLREHVAQKFPNLLIDKQNGLEETGKPDLKEQPSQAQEQLILAAMQGNLEDVENLLRQGVNIDGMDQYGNTALYMAVYSNQVQVVEFLLQQGADPDIEHPEEHWTPLMAASYMGASESLQCLISAGVDINARGRIGTALMIAVEFCRPTVVQLLVDAGADCNVSNEDGISALEFAQDAVSYSGDLERESYCQIVNLLRQGIVVQKT